MPIKIEFSNNLKVPRKTSDWVEAMIDCLPREHLRGIDRIKFVNNIQDPRSKYSQQNTELPGLYHPKQGPQTAWIEVAVNVLIPRPKPLVKRIIPRLSFRGNLAAIIFSLIGQHYYLTLRHSIKRGQIEPAVRAYTEKYFRIWHERQHAIRSKLFKPLQPTLERWGRSLQKRAAAEKKRKNTSR